MRRKYRSRKGGVAVEAALLFTFILVPLVMGIIDASLLFYNAQIITNASREAARLGIRSKDPKYTEAEIEDVVNKYCFGVNGNNKRLVTSDSSIPPDQIDVIWSNPGDTPSYDHTLTVRVTFNYQTFFFGNMGLMPIVPLRGVTEMKLEGL